MEKTAKKKFRLPISAYLLYLLLVSVLLTGVSLSKYVASTEGIDSARVAKFDVSLSGGSSVSLEAEGSQTQTLTVKNDSEVSVRCSLVAANVPAGVTVSYNPTSVDIAPGESKTVNVTFTAAADIPNEISANIGIDVQAEQID